MAILTVDDSTTIRRIVKRSVDEMGVEILEAADGASALKIIEERTSDIQLVLLDWNMPGMTGLEVLKVIKANPAYKDIVVMMLTSEADQSFVVEALKAGAQNYLTKPFDAKMLTLKIQESMTMTKA
ncbi:response regulator [candidate division KSB1 bacterium]|nr:MAG: response regulator [candidate division KSB1 bacterium]